MLEGYRRSRLRSLAIVIQVALSLVLLITAGLFVRSLSTATTLSPGFDTANMYVLPLDPTLIITDEVKLEAFYRDLMSRVGAIPGVRSVTVSRFVPLGVRGGQGRRYERWAGPSSRSRASRRLL